MARRRLNLFGQGTPFHSWSWILLRVTAENFPIRVWGPTRASHARSTDDRGRSAPFLHPI